jgi:tight adherence protein B
MTPSLLRTMLLLSFPLLAGLGAAGLLISNADRQQKALAARIMRIQPGGRRLVAATSIAREHVASAGPAAKAAALLHCDLQRADIYPVRWWIVLLGTAALGRLAAGLALPLLGVAGWALWPAVCVFASRALFARWEAQRRDKLQEQFPDALATIVRSVRVGIPVSEAIRLVGQDSEDPTGHEFRQLSNELSIGVPLDVALHGLSQRSGLPDYRFFGTTVALQAQTGGTLGEALETLADIVRRRLGLKARGFALTSEARMSAWVLCGMPFFAAGMMMLMTPKYMGVLFTTVTGHQMLGAAAISMAIGVATMRGMIRKVLT